MQHTLGDSNTYYYVKTLEASKRLNNTLVRQNSPRRTLEIAKWSDIYDHSTNRVKGTIRRHSGR